MIVTHSGWDRVMDGQKQGEGYAYGIRELLGWYGEVARGAAV